MIKTNEPKFKKGDLVTVNFNIVSEEDRTLLDLNTTLEQKEKLLKPCHINKTNKRYGAFFYTIKEMENQYEDILFKEDMFTLVDNEPNNLISWIERSK